jgi:hypothetical protein
MSTTTQTPVAERHRAALLVRGQHRAVDAMLAREAAQPAKPDGQQQAARKAQPAR